MSWLTPELFGPAIVAAITAGPLYLSHVKARKAQAMAHQDNVGLLHSIDSKMDDHHERLIRVEAEVQHHGEALARMERWSEAHDSRHNLTAVPARRWG